MIRHCNAEGKKKHARQKQWSTLYVYFAMHKLLHKHGARLCVRDIRVETYVHMAFKLYPKLAICVTSLHVLILKRTRSEKCSFFALSLWNRSHYQEKFSFTAAIFSRRFFFHSLTLSWTPLLQYKKNGDASILLTRYFQFYWLCLLYLLLLFFFFVLSSPSSQNIGYSNWSDMRRVHFSSKISNNLRRTNTAIEHTYTSNGKYGHTDTANDLHAQRILPKVACYAAFSLSMCVRQRLRQLLAATSPLRRRTQEMCV